MRWLTWPRAYGFLVTYTVLYAIWGITGWGL
jgi:hypothetical protein